MLTEFVVSEYFAFHTAIFSENQNDQYLYIYISKVCVCGDRELLQKLIPRKLFIKLTVK